MIGIGTAAIIVAVFQHLNGMKMLEQDYRFFRPSLSVKVALALAVDGLIASLPK